MIQSLAATGYSASSYYGCFYLLTGSKPLLDPYHTAVEALPNEIDDVRELTRDNPEPQKLVSEVRPIIEDRVFLLRQRIEGYEKGNPDLARLPQGREVMDQVAKNLRG